MNEMKKSRGVTTLLAASIAAVLAPQVSAQPALERRLRMMEQEMQALRAELEASRAKAEAEAAEAKAEARDTARQVEAQQAKVSQGLAELEEHKEKKDDMVFFRGGYAAMTHPRSNELLVNNSLLSPTTFGNTNEGWYVGAGLDHRLSDDSFGIHDDVALDGEILIDYKNFGNVNNALVSGLTGGARVDAQATMLTLAVSPKLKYTAIEGFRPWIVPFGLSFNVISPPSSGVTVLNPGLMLGTGLEYSIFKNLWVGADFRYNFTGGDLNYRVRAPGGGTLLTGTDTDNFTAGAYLGVGF
jgi:opacity protein-like surface antigen